MEIEDRKTEENGRETAVAEQLRLAAPADETGLKAAIEAIVYVCEEPATAAQISIALQQPPERVGALLAELVAEYAAPAHGLMVREVAGGYKMATKAEHHEAVRAFAKSLKPALKLSLAALETLATIAYKQPVTAPEIMEIRGVQGAGVLKTLLDRKLIQAAGRKNVVGRPILYKTSKDFLVQFGLKDLSELPTLKEFEELRRLAAGDEPETALPEPEAATPEPEAAPPQTEREDA
jgi:segregation and condensation protein B